jgi:hypothetical protein
MTFTLPADLAAQFARRVASRERSRFLAQALAAKLAERDREIARACEAANSDPEVQTIEEEFDSIPGEISEPWAGRAPTRRRVVGPARPNVRIRN